MPKLNLIKKSKTKSPVEDPSENVNADEEIRRGKKKEKEILYIEELLPVVDFDRELNVAIMEDGSYCDFLEITTKDLTSLSEDEVRWDLTMWEKLFKIYEDDIKIISFAFPTDTSRQAEYLQEKIEKTENPTYRKFLQTKLEEVEGVSIKFLTQSFVLMYFAKSLTDYKNKAITIMSVLGKNVNPLVRTIDADRKIAILNKLMNKNVLE